MLQKLFWFALAATMLAWAAAGTLSAQIKEYEVPTPKSRPHDPALAPDGSLCYTGQAANTIVGVEKQNSSCEEGDASSDQHSGDPAAAVDFFVQKDFSGEGVADKGQRRGGGSDQADVAP